MTKRIVLYVGTIVVMVALFVVLSDRMVTDRVPALENGFVRFLALLVLMLLLGRLARPLFRRRTQARL